MRVLHIITGLGAGGAEHQLRLLLRHLPDECEVVTLANPGTVADSIRDAGTPVHFIPMRGNRDLSALPRLVRLIRAGHFDLVHTHLYRACVYGRLAARLAGVRHVLATEHSLGTGLIEGRRTTLPVRALYRASERLGRGTVAVSGAVADRLGTWGVRAKRIRVIPNGIDLAEFRYEPLRRAFARDAYGIPRDATVIGGLGRLTPTKRFDLLIRAVAALPAVHLLLVGDGPERAALTDLARELGVADRVVFTGATPHARNLLCAMDIFASPSEQETFGMAVVEALASGLPVVWVSCPPLAELREPVGRPIGTGLAPLTAALTAELAEHAARGGARLPAPPMLARFDIAAVAGQVARYYRETAPPGRTAEPATEEPTGERRPEKMRLGPCHSGWPGCDGLRRRLEPPPL